MYRQLLAHRDYVTQKLTSNLSNEERKQLLKYHAKRVRDFQHERLIHLLVTFFFSALFIAATVAILYLPAPGIPWPAYIILTILFFLEVAYIRHYYQLENGVQSLYELTEKLGKI
jgi:fatty acid desaturase